ncbi:class I SAM-dependent methyltransferase [Deinococcus aerophilus]|uniref:Methyltransferase n=1 Tax=Deinococcus aerophilus TaxID=522488 RepID=A0ABQ2GUV5_9DEIO|nr:class I SAM-dependent methyltransferase [Deinococcus aerophilus]GGM12763.1 methyltransferase [Deinococcus aerophilus]
MGEVPHDRWGDAEAYERYVGRWSRLVARDFLGWLQVPQGRAWVDIGCGTGALSSRVLAACAPALVVGIDRSGGFVGAARERIGDGRARFEIGDATALPLDPATFDAAVSGLVMNFVPDHVAMLREMVRVTKAGGTVAAYVWDYAEGMAMMRVFWDVAMAVRPQDAHLDESHRFPLCQPEALAGLWQAQGLKAVQVRAIDIPTVFRDFEDYWAPFLGGQGAAPTYLAGVEDPVREQIRAHLQARLAPDPAGPIALSARAWAVRGTVTV